MKFEVSASARSTEKTTSSAVNGAPSWNFTFGRSLKRIVVGFSACHDSGEARLDLQVLAARDQRLVDVVGDRVVEALVLRVRIDREDVALAGPAQGFRVDGRRGEREGDGEGGRANDAVRLSWDGLPGKVFDFAWE